MGLLGFRLVAAVSVHEPSKLMYRHNKSLQTGSCNNQDVFPVSVRETKLFGLKTFRVFLQKWAVELSRITLKDGEERKRSSDLLASV